MIDNQWYDYRQEEMFQNDEIYTDKELEYKYYLEKQFFDFNSFPLTIKQKYFNDEF